MNKVTVWLNIDSKSWSCTNLFIIFKGGMFLTSHDLFVESRDRWWNWTSSLVVSLLSSSVFFQWDTFSLNISEKILSFPFRIIFFCYLVTTWIISLDWKTVYCLNMTTFHWLLDLCNYILICFFIICITYHLCFQIYLIRANK